MFLKSLLLIPIAMMTPPLPELPDLQIGDPLPAPEVRMKDVTNKDVTLSGLKQDNGLLVIFSCNTCPFVIGGDDSEGWEGRYPAIGNWCKENGVGMVLVNSNEAKRDKGDGLVDMQQHYKEMAYNCAYVLDEDHVVADAFGARTTPHVFLFDKSGKLAYKGAIDDNVRSASAVKEQWLQNALTALVGGKAIDPNTTRNQGCSIKRVQAAPASPPAQ